MTYRHPAFNPVYTRGSGRKPIDEAGKEHAHWQVLERSPNEAQNGAYWLCRCKGCGGNTVVRGALLRGRPPNCKNCDSDGADETGKEYGTWDVVGRPPNYSNHGAYWICRCQWCGDERLIRGSALRGRTPKCQRCKGNVSR